MALAIGAPFSDGGRSDDDDDLGDKENKSKYEYKNYKLLDQLSKSVCVYF